MMCKVIMEPHDRERAPGNESPAHWFFDEAAQRVMRQMLEPDIERLAEVAYEAERAYHNERLDCDFPSDWPGANESFKENKRWIARAILKAMPRQEPYAREALLHMQFIVEFTRKMDQRYREHRPEKGDSWREMPKYELITLLKEEWAELSTTPFSDTEGLMSELIDLALVAAMCHAREGEG